MGSLVVLLVGMLLAARSLLLLRKQKLKNSTTIKTAMQESPIPSANRRISSLVPCEAHPVVGCVDTPGVGRGLDGTMDSEVDVVEGEALSSSGLTSIRMAEVAFVVVLASSTDILNFAGLASLGTFPYSVLIEALK